MLSLVRHLAFANFTPTPDPRSAPIVDLAVHVSLEGDDATADGSQARPFRTSAAAFAHAEKRGDRKVEICLHEGTHSAEGLGFGASSELVIRAFHPTERE
jgi:hypothetical protein